MVGRWLKKDPLLVAITLFVITAHAAALFILSQNLHPANFQQPKNKKVTVKTIKLKPAQPPPMEEKMVAYTPPQEPKPKPKPKPPTPKPKKKTPPKQTAKPKEKPKPKPKPKIDEKKQKLLKEAQETLAKIERRSDNINTSSAKTTKISKRIDKLSLVSIKSTDEKLSSSENNYRNELANHLKAQLQLPEMGNVEVKLIVDKSGRVEKVMILSSENDRNAEYISETLPTLKLPSFGKNFKGDNSHTFHITLTNE